MSKTTDIRDLDVEQITEALKAMGEPSFRAKQIHQWLWQKGARSFEEMTNLSKSLREKLAEAFTFHIAKIHTAQHSKDGTIKVAFELFDGNKIEGVMIPTSSRTTACVSSQVGCSLDCKFCATGYLKRMRNLSAAEIFDQVWLINELAEEHHGKRLDNIVYMGMGEPLLNYVNVLRSVHLITSPEGLGMSPQRLTISTAGIAKMIQKLADDGIKTNLALSLHSANNEKRSAIMPINDSNNLEMLAEALNYWYDKTGIRPTLEYTVIEGVNDGPEEEKELVIFAKKFPSKINLIEYNPISLADYQPTDRLDAFAAALEKQKLIVHVRRSRGKDIDAACGQLANQLG
ncbi:MAG: 23S rRNA (adenine(2503)-C(2))-methyltransferase RlmN [Bacteroidetes bacterium]|jgi:23S rRNA (adenine2503-C2)-methyltransferase|nr:23S rRNA (adenine(2503)-C(2))-methyltransferase RlmN [Bacteroidota bacterium]